MDCRVKPGNDDVRGYPALTSSLRGATASSCPAKRGRGTARSAVEGAPASSFALPPQAPSTALRAVPLPRTYVRGRICKIILAARSRPSFANHHHARKKSPPPRMIPKSGVRFLDQIMRRKREAKRRKAHANHVRAAATNVTIRRCLPRGCAPLSGARPPSGASPRHSPTASTPMAQPQNRVSSKHGEKGVLPARRTTL
jgi:hypothetical protein